MARAWTVPGTGRHEAIARAVRAGLGFACGYPGTPSTEILETLATYKDVVAEWAPNEKVARTVAEARSYRRRAANLTHPMTLAGGAVMLDGHDVRAITLASLRREIALVSQDVLLFDDTIAANIAYGAMSGVSRAEVERAAAAANARTRRPISGNR